MIGDVCREEFHVNVGGVTLRPVKTWSEAHELATYYLARYYPVKIRRRDPRSGRWFDWTPITTTSRTRPVWRVLQRERDKARSSAQR